MITTVRFLITYRGRYNIAHYEYVALAKKTSVLREAMLLLFEPVNNSKTVPHRVCGYLLKPC